MRVLVTGANGFVGRALCDALLKNGHYVRGAVRSKEKVFHAGGIDFCSVGDIGPDTEWRGAMEGIDIVVHLAGRAHITNKAEIDGDKLLQEIDSIGAERLGHAAAKAGISRIVYLSTVKVCGDRTEDRPFTEIDLPRPADTYGFFKMKAEEALRHIGGKEGTEIVIVRPPLVYGPGVKANFLRLLDIISHGFPLPFALVDNSRSFIYLGNLVDAIVICVEHPSAAGNIFLVSDGRDVSTPQLIRMIAAAMGKRARLVPVPAALLSILGRLTGKRAEVERLTGSLRIDSSKIRKTLNWGPPFTMEEGVHETVKWYMSQ
ncbi:MAG: NAD-dependent epimerase/dehydratase family protein [Nitrospirae bacterium]|nr:NAD-dependent epimerase/dehydratase family protein [Nitrospirota bacterium]